MAVQRRLAAILAADVEGGVNGDGLTDIRFVVGD